MLAREQGLSGLSVDAVVARAGVSKGAFFHHFATRQDMIAALLASLAEQFEADLLAYRQAGMPFAEALVEATFAEIARDSGFMATLVGAVAADRALARQVDAQTESWTRAMIDEGAPEPVARLIRTALDGLLLQCLMRAGQPPGELLNDGLVQTLRQLARSASARTRA